MVDELHLQGELLVEQLGALLEDEGIECLGILHADLGDHVCDDLPLLEEKLHCLLSPEVLFCLAVVGQLDVLMEFAQSFRLNLHALQPQVLEGFSLLLTGIHQYLLRKNQQIVYL